MDPDFHKELDIRSLREVQMDILSAVDKFCAESGIAYSLACGSLLGAVRHGGYIPWDDDIDIYMLRPEYERFVRSFPETLYGRYKLASLGRNRWWKLTVTKVYDDRTILEENSILGSRIGVNIDVFAIDKVPDDDTAWLRFDSRRRRLVDRHQAIVSDLAGMPFSLHKLARIVMRPLARPLARYIDRYARQFNGTASEHVFESVMGQLQKNRFSIHLFDRMERRKFEDREYSAFADYDSYLSGAYGDYMQLPPEDKRITHHNFKAYFK